MKNWKKIISLSLVALMLAACNTVQGVGRDIEQVGDAIEDAAS
ncbi:entericidin A/B family lipoprotein [Ponticaulis sp.]|nr:entericidin A/B family lipoprotein [Ponticaulis sp.]|tara:strand:- start:105756 stop:105884 length:129 start_codon:yes stop_codon:yes gene_type:complete